MSRLTRFASVAVLAAAGFVNAQAATLASNGTWQSFDVSGGIFGLSLSGGNEWIDINDGSPLRFTFTIGSGQVGLLTVVDTAFAGDTFNVFNGASLLGATTAVPVGIYDPFATATVDPDLALANSSFSRGIFTLGAGGYNITGVLNQSVLESVGGAPLNSTSGNIRLTVAPIPEPETYAMLLAGLGLLGVAARRRA
jgi:hypothetical protein